jgi:hypothetical protein
MSGYITPPSVSRETADPTPASRAASASLWFALSMFLANLLMTAVWAATNSPSTVWIVELAHLLVALALFSLALAFGVRGLGETAGGRIRGRGQAIAGIIVASVLLLGAAIDIIAALEVTFLS